jgi:hypothetical protein
MEIFEVEEKQEQDRAQKTSTKSENSAPRWDPPRSFREASSTLSPMLVAISNNKRKSPLRTFRYPSIDSVQLLRPHNHHYGRILKRKSPAFLKNQLLAPPKNTALDSWKMCMHPPTQLEFP